MKGVVEEFFEKSGMKKKVHYTPDSNKTYLHPGRQANISYEGKVVGYLGEVHPLVADNYGIGERTYIAVIDIQNILEFCGFNHKFTGIAKYPAVTRDLSMVVPKHVLAGQIEDILEGQGGSTAVVGVLYNEGLSFVSVGDSFLYLKRGSNLYRLNQEHTMCQQIFLECIRSGDINPETGRNDPETVALTQFLGMTGFNEIDGTVRPIPVMEGDVLFACSDGIGGTLDEREIFMALSRNDVHEMCSYIEKNVLAHGKPNQDNFTGVVVKCVK